MTTLRFSNVQDDTTIGHVTMTATGLEYDTAEVEQLMAPRVARLGEARAFALANGRSNGYVASQEVEEPDGPDVENPQEDDAEAKARRSRQLALLETRVAGHDVTPGHDQLHHWWTKGPGLARWIGSPHQYTTLHAELVKATKGKLPPGEIDRMAASWVHEVTGEWPGSDMHRVLEGHKPRGSRIGPG